MDGYDISELVIGIIALILNTFTMFALIILIIVRTKSRTVFMCEMNLVISDIGIAIFLIVKQYKSFDRTECTAFVGYGLTTLYASLLSITLVTIDRFFYLYHDVYYETWFNWIRTFACIFALWCISAIIGFLPLKWVNTRKSECDFISESRNFSLLYRSLMALFLVSCIIFVSATIIYRQIRHHPTSSLPLFFQTKIKSLIGFPLEIMIRCGLMIFFLLILWFPNIVISIHYDLHDDDVKHEKMKSMEIKISLLLIYCNSIFNPILYTWSHYGFYSYILHRCLPRDLDNISIRSAMHIMEMR